MKKSEILFLAGFAAAIALGFGAATLVGNAGYNNTAQTGAGFLVVMGVAGLVFNFTRKMN